MFSSETVTNSSSRLTCLSRRWHLPDNISLGRTTTINNNNSSRNLPSMRGRVNTQTSRRALIIDPRVGMAKVQRSDSSQQGSLKATNRNFLQSTNLTIIIIIIITTVNIHQLGALTTTAGVLDLRGEMVVADGKEVFFLRGTLGKPEEEKKKHSEE